MGMLQNGDETIADERVKISLRSGIQLLSQTGPGLW